MVGTVLPWPDDKCLMVKETKPVKNGCKERALGHLVNYPYVGGRSEVSGLCHTLSQDNKAPPWAEHRFGEVSVFTEGQRSEWSSRHPLSTGRKAEGETKTVKVF